MSALCMDHQCSIQPRTFFIYTHSDYDSHFIACRYRYSRALFFKKENTEDKLGRSNIVIGSLKAGLRARASEEGYVHLRCLRMKAAPIAEWKCCQVIYNTNRALWNKHLPHEAVIVMVELSQIRSLALAEYSRIRGYTSSSRTEFWLCSPSACPF